MPGRYGSAVKTNRMIYLDNAATTAMDGQVLEAMLPYFKESFGNPSSLYAYGVQAKLAVEAARKKVASILNATPSEIIFTSGGTEAINTALRSAVDGLGCRHIITSPIEHHAVLHTIQYLERSRHTETSYVKLLPDGYIDLEHLDILLHRTTKPTLVALMHANNETGNKSDLEAIGQLCEKNGAVFFSDTVQTVGHYPFDLSHLPVDFITASGHKFHGPKGTGILFHRKGLNALLFGGGQESGLRSGTENVAGIVGFAKALELATTSFEADSTHIAQLKTLMIRKLQQAFPTIQFNGDVSADNLYTVLSCSLPKKSSTENLLFELGQAGICASGGSACSGGASHVIEALDCHFRSKVTVRFSFSKHNTAAELDRVVECIKQKL